jgi:glutathione S-transferase
MAPSPITLYHYASSSSSFRVRLALAQKGLAYEPGYQP